MPTADLELVDQLWLQAFSGRCIRSLHYIQEEKWNTTVGIRGPQHQCPCGLLSPLLWSGPMHSFSASKQTDTLIWKKKSRESLAFSSSCLLLQGPACFLPLWLKPSSRGCFIAGDAEIEPGSGHSILSLPRRQRCPLSAHNEHSQARRGLKGWEMLVIPSRAAGGHCVRGLCNLLKSAGCVTNLANMSCQQVKRFAQGTQWLSGRTQSRNRTSSSQAGTLQLYHGPLCSLWYPGNLSTVAGA